MNQYSPKVNFTSQQISADVAQLIQNQLLEWPIAAANYAGLKNVVCKKLTVNGVNVSLQFNPHRIVSSSAKVDDKSINERPCFLCPQNLPAEQKHVAFDSSFQILVNPFPIFTQHLTIPSYHHTPQRIFSNFGSMLQLANHLTDFTVFYNGPKCGASAPDHLHFQAGNKGFLPIENDFLEHRYTTLFAEVDGVSIWQWHNYLRSVVTFEATDENALVLMLQKFYDAFTSAEIDIEPMLNLLCYQSNNGFVVHWFPRKCHRPSHYFRAGDQQILISPASVDLGGVLIFPRPQDFERITVDEVIEIFDEVCVANDELLPLLNKLLISK